MSGWQPGPSSEPTRPGLPPVPPPPPPYAPPPTQPGHAGPPGPPPSPYGYGYGAPPPPPRRGAPWLLIGILTAVVVLLVGGVIGTVLLVAGDDDEPADRTDATAPTEVTSEPTEPTEPTEPESSTPSAPEPSETSESAIPRSAVVGHWYGSYECAQGKTLMALAVTEGAGGDGVEALFTFTASADNPGVETGAFDMEGTFVDGRLELSATDWVIEPKGYVTVDLTATVTEPRPRRLEGEILGAGCSTFVVEK